MTPHPECPLIKRLRDRDIKPLAGAVACARIVWGTASTSTEANFVLADGTEVLAKWNSTFEHWTELEVSNYGA